MAKKLTSSIVVEDLGKLRLLYTASGNVKLNWVGQKVLLGFSLRYYRKVRTNFLANSIQPFWSLAVSYTFKHTSTILSIHYTPKYLSNRDQWLNQSCLSNETSIKTTNWRWLGDSVRGHVQRAWKPCALSVLCLLHLFHLAIPELRPLY